MIMGVLISASPVCAGVSATPSVAGTPLRGGLPGGGPGMTPMRTPIRDELGLNDPDMLLPAEASRREARAREAMEKNSLRAGLAGLPAPSNEYQIVVPEVWKCCLLCAQTPGSVNYLFVCPRLASMFNILS